VNPYQKKAYIMQRNFENLHKSLQIVILKWRTHDSRNLVLKKTRRSCQPKSDLIELFLKQEENFASIENILYYSNSNKN